MARNIPKRPRRRDRQPCDPRDAIVPEELRCTDCGLCCHFDIPLELEDIVRLADYSNQSPTEVMAKWVQTDPSPGSHLLLLEKQVGSQACIFLTDTKLCSIHPARPSVCAAYDCDPQLKQSAIP